MIRIALCGIGGYGAYHIQCMRRLEDKSRFKLIAAVDPAPECSSEYQRLKEDGVRIYPTLEQFFQEDRCDLVFISSPVQFHCEQTILALQHGANVLCEKPLCTNEAEAESMAECERKSGKQVSIGYQWSFSPGIIRLKDDILAGRFGRPLAMKTLVCWPRNTAYYRRNNWAGRIFDPQGRAILDSPVSNATAHFLHNMLYVLGDRVETSAWPARVEGLLCRANQIENFDTAALKITTEDGVPICFFTSHASADQIDPMFEYEFETAKVTYSQDRLRAILADGNVIEYESPLARPDAKLEAALDLIRHGGKTRCGITAARAHTRCVILIHESLKRILEFQPALISSREESGVKRIFVEGLQELMLESYRSDRPESLAGILRL